MPKISAVIITYNEERNIERCIKSVLSVVDEVIVVDSFSTDRTEAICRNLGATFHQHTFEGYRDQKNYAVQLASFDYILSLDADEALSEELKQSILAAKNTWDFDGYYSNRLNNYCGQWIYHSNWYPDRKIRLFDRRKGAWGGLNIHETVRMSKDAKVGYLSGDILHWSLASYEEHVDKANRFSTISAKEYHRIGKRSSILKIIVNSGWHFLKAYVLRLGFLDGYNGFVISALSAYTCFLKYVKLRRLILADRNGGVNATALGRKKKKIQIAS